MGFSSFPSSSQRLKREECKHTKHDSVFSNWEILIGSSDWENHSLGIQGIQRYCIHNLPLNSSCPGLYELGVAAIRTDLGRNIRKIDKDCVVVVYLGQADNVRTRLQHYGRAGSHLNSEKLGFDIENGGGIKGPGLFREIFKRGFPIVFRWAPMESKKLAERTEAQLLTVFDYAWNKGGNGDRRADDVYRRLDLVVSRNVSSFVVRKKFHKWLEKYLLRKKKEGIEIKSSSALLKEGKFASGKVTVKLELDKEDPVVCGLSLGDGTICTRSPVEGRKRCEAHKGKRNIGHSPNSVKHVRAMSLKDEPGSLESSMHITEIRDLHEGKMGCPSQNDEKFLPEKLGTVCGVTLNDMSICVNNPIEGRKRCSIHKGMRINGSHTKSAAEGSLRCCGVGLGGGNVCMEVPAHGRKRCEIHKGRRDTASY
ncbi:hypothetical protein ACHQM5_010670 [Ranunculus cassubicifolius]